MTNYPDNVFDPTSSASMTASFIMLAAVLCMVSASYTMGKLRDMKETPAYQISLWSLMSGITLLAGALYIFFAYD